MPTSPPSTSITSQYAAQVTKDLEHNAAERERITAELTALQAQLDVLHSDQTVLENIYKTLPSGSAGGPALPRNPAKQRGRKAVAGTTSTKRSPVKKAAKSTPKKAAASTAPGSKTRTQPTLVELVRTLLDKDTQPLSAAEVASKLAAQHPQRTIKATVVRTTLENLVAKSLAHRTKQGSSVFYTRPDTTSGESPNTKQAPTAN